MKPSWSLIILVVYITWLVTAALENVGEISPQTTYKWYLPFELLLFAGFPAYLGYEIGKEELK